MIEQKKFYKLCKYGTKMKNSLIYNNHNDYIKYYDHLKYHIREQIGNGINPNLDKLFNDINNFIANNKEIYNIDEIKKKISEDKTQLETKLEEYQLQINKLKLDNKLISENKLELDETKSKIMKLEKQKLDINNKLKETQNKLKEAYSDDKIINKLKNTQTVDYDKFINLLQELFKQIYDEEIASKIIDEIKEGKTWKDEKDKKKEREDQIIIVNNFPKKWSNIIDTLQVLNPYESNKLISDINDYINNGTGNVDNLIDRFKSELNKSIKKIKK